MDRKGFIAVFCILLFVSTNCNAASSFHRRKLIDSEHNNGSTTSSKVSPTTVPVNETKTNPNNTEKPQQDKQIESQAGNQTNSNVTLPVDPKGSSKPANDTKTVGAPTPPADVKNGSTVTVGNAEANKTTPDLGNIDSCDGSIVSCTNRGMLACILTSNDGGSKGLFLVVKNEGEITLRVNVKVSHGLKYEFFPVFEVHKHKTNRLDISSYMGQSREVIVNSGKGKCVLPLVKSASVKNILHQISFYSKQVTPVYAMYASFVVALLLGGTWACCRFRKRNQDGIPYQELEMGIPESSSAVNLDGEAEGWDDNWDDDWDEDNTVISPSGNQVRSVSSNGLVSRSSKKDGWENDWDD